MDSYLTSTSCLLLVCRSHPHNCCTAYRVVLCITETYRETHHVSDPRWVEFDFGCSTICQVLIGLMRDRQNRQSRWSRCVENPNQCQPNQGPTLDRPPCTTRPHHRLTIQCFIHPNDRLHTLAINSLMHLFPNNLRQKSFLEFDGGSFNPFEVRVNSTSRRGRVAAGWA